MDYLYLLSGLVFLVAGGEFLVKASVALALRMRVSTLVIGMTIVSFATSAPELIVSIQASLSGHSDITFGNVIGSNIANIGLVLGLTSALFTLTVTKNSYQIDWPMMMVATVLLYLFVAFDHVLNFWEGLLFVAMLVVFGTFLIRKSRKESAKESYTDEVDEAFGHLPLYKALPYLGLASLALYFGSDFLIEGATGLARTFNISERIISVTVISIGTSLPELAASFMAAIRKEKELSIGNLVGSNIFNILGVLGVTALFGDIPLLDTALFSFDYYWMAAISFLLLPIIFLFSRKEINRVEGGVLFLAYILYMSFVF